MNPEPAPSAARSVVAGGAERVGDQRRGGGDARVGTGDQRGGTVTQGATAHDERVVRVAERRVGTRLHHARQLHRVGRGDRRGGDHRQSDGGKNGDANPLQQDRKNVVEGKRVDLGGRPS